MSDEEYICPLLGIPCLEEKCMWWVFEEDTCVLQVLCSLLEECLGGWYGAKVRVKMLYCNVLKGPCQPGALNFCYDSMTPKGCKYGAKERDEHEKA